MPDIQRNLSGVNPDLHILQQSRTTKLTHDPAAVTPLARRVTPAATSKTGECGNIVGFLKYRGACSADIYSRSRDPRPARHRAFTLLELLVAVAITLLLAVLMGSVVRGTLVVWQRTQQDFTTAAQAKLVLDMVERDLQAALFRPDGGTWLAVDVISSPANLVTHGWLMASPRLKPVTAASLRLLPTTADGSTPVITDARFGLSGAWLRLITSNVETAGSLPVAVSYQLARRPISGPIAATTLAAVRYTLFRSAVSNSISFATGNDVTVAGYGSASSSPSVARSAPTLTNPSGTDALATNVVDFGLWFFVLEPGAGGLRRIFPADDSDTAHAAREVGSAAEANRFPDVADIMVRILTESGATMLAEMESGRETMLRPPGYSSDADWWWAIVEEHSRVYTRRVEVKGVAR